MGKHTGLGDRFEINAVDVSGDVASLSAINIGAVAIDQSSIASLARERGYGIRDGTIEFDGYFNTANNGVHQFFADLPTENVTAVYRRGNLIGNPIATLFGARVQYDVSSPQGGGMTVKGKIVGSQRAPLLWGIQAAVDSLTGPVEGPAIDLGVPGIYYVAFMVTGLTGGDIIFTLQDSPNGGEWNEGTSTTVTEDGGVLLIWRTDQFVRVNISGSFTAADVETLAS